MLKRILLVVVGIALALLAVSFLLPSTYRVERSVTINATPERIFVLVNDLHHWSRWGVWWKRDPAMRTTYSGALLGKGASQSWDSDTQGKGRMTITASEPGRSVTYDLYFPEWDSHSTGRVVLAPDGKATRVTWSDEGRLGNNPVLRWLGLFFDRMIGPDFEQGLARLKSVAEGGSAEKP